MGIPALFEARGGLSIGIHVIAGDGAPNGGRADTAVVGSFYADQIGGQLYVKKASGTGADKWTRQQNQEDLTAALLGQSWREPVVCLDATTYADLAAAEAAVNTGTIDGVAVVNGNRILFTGITGASKNVFIVTGIPGSGATLVEEGNAASKGDALFIQDGSVAGRKYGYNGTAWVQQGLEERTELGYLRNFVGKSSEGNESPDYASTNVVADGASLETAIGSLDAEIGPDVTSTKHISAAATIKANLSTLDDVLGDAKQEKKADGVTSSTVLDSVLVDDVLAAEWTVHARSVATPSQVWAGKILAIHNGTSTTDATDMDYNTFGVLKLGGAIPNLDFEVVVSGSGTSQVMQLKGSSGAAVNIRITRSVLNEQ